MAMSTRTQIERDGKKLWRVDVEQTRTAVFWVLGDEDAAKVDADVLASELQAGDWDDVDLDWGIAPARTEPGDHDPVWTGGPEGRQETWR